MTSPFVFVLTALAGTCAETWIYGGATTAIAAPFGQGCPTSAGATTLSPGTTPVLGTNYVLDIANGPANTFAFVTHGFDNLTWPLGRLPVDLSAYGLTGCRLEVAPAVTVGVAVNGTGQLALALPNDPALAALQLYSQAFVLDGAAPNGIGGITTAVHAVLGY